MLYVEALFAWPLLGRETRLFQFLLFHGSESSLGQFKLGRDFGFKLKADHPKSTITLRSLPRFWSPNAQVWPPGAGEGASGYDGLNCKSALFYVAFHK